MEKRSLSINGVQVPVFIYRERRRSVRFSIGKKGLNLRLPWWLGKADRERQVAQLQVWAQKQFDRQPGLEQRFTDRSYVSGDVLRVGQRSYTLQIQLEDRKTHTAVLRGGVIEAKLSVQVPADERPQDLRRLLSRVVAQDFLPEITQRVHTLNAQHYQQPIQQVRLKYNRSNWGSCSAKGNINLSTRLLFAPNEVIDYVIIHELAHRIELNHSPRFWALVERASPDYKLHERWLKENGHQCDF